MQLMTLTSKKRGKVMTESKQRRALETRTKIAYGGLVHKSNLPSFLGLELGDEIHIEDNWDKEAIILGALINAYEDIMSSPSRREHYRFLGEKSLKYGKGPSPAF